MPAHPVSSPWRSLVPGLHTPSPILPRLTLSHTGYRHTRVHSCMAEASGSLKSPHWAGSIPGTQAPSSAQASARWLRRLHGRWATVSQHAPLCGFCGLQVVMTTECWTCVLLWGHVSLCPQALLLLCLWMGTLKNKGWAQEGVHMALTCFSTLPHPPSSAAWAASPPCLCQRAARAPFPCFCQTNGGQVISKLQDFCRGCCDRPLPPSPSSPWSGPIVGGRAASPWKGSTAFGVQRSPHSSCTLMRVKSHPPGVPL